MQDVFHLQLVPVGRNRPARRVGEKPNLAWMLVEWTYVVSCVIPQNYGVGMVRLQLPEPYVKKQLPTTSCGIACLWSVGGGLSWSTKKYSAFGVGSSLLKTIWTILQFLQRERRNSAQRTGDDNPGVALRLGSIREIVVAFLLTGGQRRELRRI